MALRDAAEEGVIYGAIHPAIRLQIVDRMRDTDTGLGFVNLRDATEVQVTVNVGGVDCYNAIPSQSCMGNPIEVGHTLATPISSKW